jgi:hypothetical protein
MFKGFEILSGEEWASVLQRTGLTEANTAGAAAPRRLIVGGGHNSDSSIPVWTSNDAPPESTLPFHTELG